ncbi:MAG TPA: RnfABCDGE type electron transport complex subunit B [Gammaproteobacteria bacterium]|nr:RnfABCDGE type electron transport complex subunit B [Gammaproteobacteria bacterium]
MLPGIVVIVLLASALASVLIFVHERLSRADGSLADRIETLLPRIQCGQCGYPGCRPYAEALAHGTAPPNLCPPGGTATAHALADLLGLEARPVAPDQGTATIAQVARIDEAACIGCNLCVRACPVDAIVGVPQMMHTVLGDHCTGCELCLPPCPVDCIDIVPRRA